MTMLSRLLRDDAGATMVEYAVMVVLIAAVCIAAVTSLGKSTSTQYASFNSAL